MKIMLIDDDILNFAQAEKSVSRPNLNVSISWYPDIYLAKDYYSAVNEKPDVIYLDILGVGIKSIKDDVPELIKYFSKSKVFLFSEVHPLESTNIPFALKREFKSHVKSLMDNPDQLS